ncbi:virB8 family protein [uncultured Tateyamaria sp.]|uniref:virB8 family protein n=1 Tax=uncultured Tateyamaria sp. TaxID=455651 RepID=UPI00260D1865|nr:type IV secretion system protein [uncultured Tateyamaria sp.]
MTTGFTPEERRILESEAIFGVQRRERFAWTVAGGGLLVGLAAVAALVIMLPLKQTEVYLAVVDKDTGIAERAVSVERATVEHKAAIEQSLLYKYLVDRETYNPADNEARMLRVFRQSAGQARAGLQSLWQEGSPNFPPTVYGSDARVEIQVLSITEVAENTAQIRFTKTLSRPDEPTREGKFYATVVYDFRPQNNASLKTVWEHPFGFTATNYRVTSETGG